MFVLKHMSGATTEMPNTLQPGQSFRRTFELQLLALNVPCLRSPKSDFSRVMRARPSLLFCVQVSQQMYSVI